MKHYFKFVLGMMASTLPLLSFGSHPGVGSELDGNSLEALRSDGGRAVIFFKAGHQIDFDVAMGARTAHYHGIYSVKDEQLCFLIKGNRDCWIYNRTFEIGHSKKLSAVGKSNMTAVYTLRPGRSGQIPTTGKQ